MSLDFCGCFGTYSEMMWTDRTIFLVGKPTFTYVSKKERIQFELLSTPDSVFNTFIYVLSKEWLIIYICMFCTVYMG